MTVPQKAARVRFAPSPTGNLHLGGARTALYDYLLAKQTGGQFILRIEDTDRKRLVPGTEEELMSSLRWLGLEWDEGPDIGGPYGPYRQSERKEIYQKYARQLIESGHAYYCFCTSERLQKVRQQQQKEKRPPRYDRTCRRLSPQEAAERVSNGEKHVIRFKTPIEGTTTVKDRIRGEITVNNQTLDDFILVKSDGLALYHLAAMVDDHLMKITHVFRGEEWLATFPLHALIYRALGWEEPEWVHLSIFLKPGGKGKLSKRDTAQILKSGKAIFVKDMAKIGYLPDAVNNWIALMGWGYDDQREFFTLENLVELFSLDRLRPSSAAINFSKLDHFNGLHIRALTSQALSEQLVPYFQESGYPITSSDLKKITPIIQERMVTLDDGPALAGFFFEETVSIEPEQLLGKKMDAEQSAQAARKSLAVLQNASGFSHEEIELPLRACAEEMSIKAGQLFGILRMAVTGQKVSPPLLESMEILGRKKVLQRVQQAIEQLEKLANAS